MNTLIATLDPNRGFGPVQTVCLASKSDLWIRKRNATRWKIESGFTEARKKYKRNWEWLQAQFEKGVWHPSLRRVRKYAKQLGISPVYLGIWFRNERYRRKKHFHQQTTPLSIPLSPNKQTQGFRQSIDIKDNDPDPDSIPVPDTDRDTEETREQKQTDESETVFLSEQARNVLNAWSDHVWSPESIAHLLQQEWVSFD